MGGTEEEQSAEWGSLVVMVPDFGGLSGVAFKQSGYKPRETLFIHPYVSVACCSMVISDVSF